MPLVNIDAVVTDMDGVLWRGEEPLPGLIEFFDFLREKHIPIVLATNNSRRSQDNYIQKLTKLGLPFIEKRQIVTSGTATASYLQDHYPAGTRIYVIGGDGLREVLTESGFVLADEDVELVVAGIDFDFTYEKARRGALLIRGGATFVGTNPDASFPAPEGLLPGAGSILAMLASATDVQPIVIGKPGLAMFEAALKILGTAPERTIMIGDRIGTDIEGGQNAGLKTALVMTGVTTAEELATSDIKPDSVYSGLPELLADWQS